MAPGSGFLWTGAAVQGLALQRSELPNLWGSPPPSFKFPCFRSGICFLWLPLISKLPQVTKKELYIWSLIPAPHTELLIPWNFLGDGGSRFNEVTLGRPLNSFRTEAPYQKAWSEGRSFQPQLLISGKGRGLKTELITNGQWFMISPAHTMEPP